jgi:hypothetical protein
MNAPRPSGSVIPIPSNNRAALEKIVGKMLATSHSNCQQVLHHELGATTIVALHV